MCNLVYVRYSSFVLKVMVVRSRVVLLSLLQDFSNGPVQVRP